MLRLVLHPNEFELFHLFEQGVVFEVLLRDGISRRLAFTVLNFYNLNLLLDVDFLLQLVGFLQPIPSNLRLRIRNFAHDLSRLLLETLLRRYELAVEFAELRFASELHVFQLVE